jgi:hypothetical protein
MQVLDRDPVPPRALRCKLDRDLETICLKCLHKEPERRYESAAALARSVVGRQAPTTWDLPRNYRLCYT